MRFRRHLKTVVVAVLLAGAAAIVVWQVNRPGGSSPPVSVKAPELSPSVAAGKKAFEANCARCHGVNASGSDQGPPLVHAIYNPGHHADVAFYLAAKRGVFQHHWNFGEMPPQPQVSDEEMAAIIRYVRELQRANGIR